jgi:hypothetical protein
VRHVFPQSNGWQVDKEEEDETSDTNRDNTHQRHPTRITADTPDNFDTNPGATLDQDHSRYQPNTGYGCALFDARNGFNELNRYQMLWAAGHLWPQARRFVFNIHRHDIICIVRTEPKKAMEIIHCSEGISQGGVLGMSLYGIATLPLARSMREAIPDALQPWFADDSSAVGTAEQAAQCLLHLQQEGPRYGYFPEASKCIYVCKAEDEPTAREVFERHGLKILYSRGERYLGGFVGSGPKKEEWINEKVAKWVTDVKIMAQVAVNHPQAAYIGFVKCKQAEWQYLQRVVADIAHLFEPLEEAIRTYLLPALLGMQPNDLCPDERQILSHSVKTGGLGIQNPLDTAPRVHQVSLAATKHLTESLVDAQTSFDLQTHTRTARAASQEAHRGQIEDETIALTRRGRNNVSLKRRDKRNCSNGAWLTVIPTTSNGTVLGRDEWDSVRLRYNKAPQGMQSHCDGCNSVMTVEHAMTCKKGGLVTARHNILRDQWHNLLANATTPSKCTREPRIYMRERRPRQVPNQEMPNPPALPPQTTNTTEERGDISCHAFWAKQRDTIFDVRITDSDAPAHRTVEVPKLLARQEKEKKNKYLQSCLEMRKDFTPLVYTVDGVAGREARSAEKRLAALLADKWKRSYSQMVYYVKVRIQLSLVRTTSLLIRGSRNHQGHCWRNPPDGAAMSDWQTWQETA